MDIQDFQDLPGDELPQTAGLIPYTCCFTGHQDIPKYDEQKIITRVRYLLKPLLQAGVRYFGVGGAVGFDMIVAEYLLHLRDDLQQDIRIISVLPFPEWRAKWNEDQIRRQDEIMRRSDKVSFVSDAYHKGVYLLRDRKLVDESLYCISYCHRTTGGTAYTVRYAMQKGLYVYNAGSWDLRQLKR